MHPYLHAQTNPDKAALIMAGSGETVTYRELDDRSNQGAQLFRAIGLQAGDGIAFFIENHPRYYELLWAAQRAGWYQQPLCARRNRQRFREFRGGTCPLSGNADCRPDVGQRDALFVGHHRPAQGRQARRRR
jgi:hypothetical protein